MQHIGGIIGALCAWWAVAVIVGLMLYTIWPSSFPPNDSLEGVRSFSFMAGIALGSHWQNIPGNILGFVLALYTFRYLSKERVISNG